MSETQYQAIVMDYADGVRALFAPAGAPSGERGGRGPASFDELAEQAEQLSPVSDALGSEAGSQLNDPDPSVREIAETRLLAKALTDLEVSSFLLMNATDQEDELVWAQQAVGERSAGGRSAVEDPLRILLGEQAVGPQAVARSGEAPLDGPAAVQMLTFAIDDTLVLISERAGKTGQAALGGMIGLGVAEVARAAGIVGLDIAQALGKAEQVTRLYNLVREFALKAYNSLVALLGEGVAQSAAKQVLDWVKKVQEGEQFTNLLEKLYGTQTTREELTELVASQEVPDAEKISAAAKAVEGLNSMYGQKTSLAEDLLKKLRFVQLLPAAVLPQGRVLLAAAYLVLGGYVVLAGADYVDAQNLKLLDRVPGVRQVVRTQLDPT